MAASTTRYLANSLQNALKASTNASEAVQVHSENNQCLEAQNYGPGRRVRNATGSSIADGTALTVSSYSTTSNFWDVKPADPEDYANNQILGFANGAIADGAIGNCVDWLVLTGLDTSTTQGANYPVFASNTSGAVAYAPEVATNTDTTGVVQTGVVLKKDATSGAILLSKQFLSNAVDQPPSALGNSWYCDFRGFRPSAVGPGGTGNPTGTAGDENLFKTGNCTGGVYHILGTQTVVVPGYDEAKGWDIGAMDQTANDGVELSPMSGTGATSPYRYKVGTHPFYVEWLCEISDVSGTDDCAFGFRKAEAFQANIDDYADMAVLNAISGDVKGETIVGGAATTTTDTTNNVADLQVFRGRIEVNNAGVATFLVGTGGAGTLPTLAAPNAPVAAYTFTAGLDLVPFAFFLQDSDKTSCHIKYIKAGVLM